MRARVSIFYSLSTQIFVGANLLLGLSIFATSYFLIVHQQHTLTAELEKAVILQGRNIALSSVKPLLRSDPEFELYPLVTSLLQDAEHVESIVIVDAAGTIQGHEDLVMVSKPYEPDNGERRSVAAQLLSNGETLLSDEKTYLFVTPVTSARRRIGTVYLVYSKEDLIAGRRAALALTIKFGAAALILGMLLSLAFFRNISQAMTTMLEGVDAIGRGQLDTRITVRARNEFRILANAFNSMTSRIAAAQKDLVAKERVDRELEIAADIQQSLIPAEASAPKGFAIGRHYRSAFEVGGDYVDVVPMSGGRVGFVIGDVAGKGVPGLVVMAMVKVMVQQLLTSGDTPGEILRSVNRSLLGKMKRNMFVTIFVAVLDPARRHLSFSNAGHNPLAIYEDASREARLLKMEGIPLGIFQPREFDPSIRDYELVLRTGDVLLQYTDGLTESKGARGMFGLQRVLDAMTTYGRYGAETLVAKLVEEEKQFRGDAEQADDITLLALGATADVEAREKVRS